MAVEYPDGTLIYLLYTEAKIRNVIFPYSSLGFGFPEVVLVSVIFVPKYFTVFM